MDSPANGKAAYSISAYLPQLWPAVGDCLTTTIDMAGRADIHISPGRKLSPEVEIQGRVTRVLAEQTAAVDPGRLGDSVGYLSLDEMGRVDAALRIVLEL